eukprot:scaffold43041_cov24-Phaeocystis_antarctica.AAC.1
MARRVTLKVTDEIPARGEHAHWAPALSLVEQHTSGTLRPPAPWTNNGGGAGGSIGFSVRYQGELLGIWDLQNRDPRRKSPPETEKSVG